MTEEWSFGLNRTFEVGGKIVVAFSGGFWFGKQGKIRTTMKFRRECQNGVGSSRSNKENETFRNDHHL